MKTVVRNFALIGSYVLSRRRPTAMGRLNLQPAIRSLFSSVISNGASRPRGPSIAACSSRPWRATPVHRRLHGRRSYVIWTRALPRPQLLSADREHPDRPARAQLQVDEIWGFVGAKARNANSVKKAAGEAGDAWLWLATDAETKLDAWAYLAMSIADATRKLLKSEKRTINTSGLVAAITSGGLASDGLCRSHKYC